MKRGVIVLVGLVLLVVVIILTIVIGNSRKKAPSQVTLKIWAPFDYSQAYQDISKSFLTSNPNVKVEFKYIQANDAAGYEATVVNAIAAGNGPDIWLIRNDWLPKHQTKIVPQPSSIKFSTSSNVSESDAMNNLFTHAVVGQNTRDNKLYGIPLAVDSLALYINTKILRDTQNQLQMDNSPDAQTLSNFPTTWSDVARWSQIFTQKSNGKITQAGIALGTTDNTYAPVDVYLSMLAQYGGGLYTSDEKSVELNLANTDSASTTFPGQQSLQLYTSFAKQGGDNYTWNSQLGDPVQAFVNGKLAMMIGYSSLKVKILEVNKDFQDATIIPLPQVKNVVSPTDKRVDYAAYWTNVVSNRSSNQLLSWQLLKSFLSPDNLRVYAQDTGTVGLLQLQGIEFQQQSRDDLGQSDIFASQIATSQVMYKPEWQGADQTVQDMINQVVGLNQSVQTAVDTAAAKLKSLIAQ